jgi:hypothetical protein
METESPTQTASGVPAAETLSPARGRRHVWGWALAGFGVLAASALIAVSVLAANYQPLSIGGNGSTAELFPGLPAGQGIHMVNTVGGIHQDFYIPPQRGTFSLLVDITNNGSYAVTIESVSLPAGGPVTLAGPVRYSTPGMGGSNEIPPPVSRVLRDVVLRPGQDLFLGFPVRTWPCAQQYEWTSEPSFNVTMRFALFTRTVAMPWGSLDSSLVMHAPAGRPGDAGTFCLPHTALPK